MQRLLDQHPGRGAEEVIREKARALISMAMTLNWRGPPFNMEELASLRGIRVERDRSGTVSDAVLVPDEQTNEFTIRVAVGAVEERERYNIPHEITHTFFPDCAMTIRQRGGDGPNDKELEALCDLGASEMLFPYEPFLADLQSLGGPSFEALTVLRERYHASWEATGNRMISVSDDTAAMIVLSHRLKPVEERGGPWTLGAGPEPKLRVDYSVRAGRWRGERAFVPQHKSIPDASCLYDLLADFVMAGSPDERVAAVEDWSSLRLGHVEVHAMRIVAVNAPPKVLAVLTPAR